MVFNKAQWRSKKKRAGRDNRELRDKDKVTMMKDTDVMFYAKFLCMDDVFSQVNTFSPLLLRAV